MGINTYRISIKIIIIIIIFVEVHTFVDSLLVYVYSFCLKGFDILALQYYTANHNYFLFLINIYNTFWHLKFINVFVFWQKYWRWRKINLAFTFHSLFIHFRSLSFTFGPRPLNTTAFQRNAHIYIVAVSTVVVAVSVAEVACGIVVVVIVYLLKSFFS